MNTQAQRKYKVLLIGDKGSDIYTYGSVDRISPEAPIPVFNLKRQVTKPGMADNVRLNLEALGCDVTFIHGDVSEKERLIDERSRQQIVRIDKDIKSPPLLINKTMMEGYDAIVISDYNKGSVSYELIEQAIRTKTLVFVDTKKTDLERLQGAWVKINQLEHSKVTSECTGLIVTMGSLGAEAKWHDIYVQSPIVEVVDVTGAGDTFLSALAYKYLETKELRQSMEFANKAASVTVQHLGCYAPRPEEIK